MYGIEIPKQRGIYSEILTTEDTENLRVSHSNLLYIVLTAHLSRITESVDLWTKQGHPLQGQRGLTEA